MEDQMNCVECGAPMKNEPARPLAYVVGGLPRVTLRGVTVRRCRKGHVETAIPRIAQLHRVIAEMLVRKPRPLAAEEVRFLRRHLGYSQVDFARRMGVAAESVSRWESGSVRLAPTAERLLRLMVVTQAPIADYSLDVLAKVQGTRAPIEMKLTSTATEWLAA
jgi:putative zinc finger/helix-turn-helix YgiT family protein